MKKLMLMLLMFSTVLAACGTEESPQPANISIKSGQSFGFCMGYCISEMEIKGSAGAVTIVFEDRIENKKKEYQAIISESDWKAILAAYEASNFQLYDKVYGCPDCADGGAEYIEIIQSGKSQRVTFEYGHSVKGLEGLIGLLRARRMALIEKYAPKK